MKISKFIIIFTIALFAVACMKDKGNYDYSILNDVTISGFKPVTDNSGVYVTEHNQLLEIKPEIKQKLVNEPTKLSYIWKIGNDTVSREKDLNYKVSGKLPFGKISCLYVVIDKSNGMKYFKSFSMVITNPFSFGWYILTEKPDNYSEIAHLSTNRKNSTFTYTDAISGYKLGKPTKIKGTFGYIDALSDYFWTIFILTKEGEYPCIQTENGTFMANFLVSSKNFVDKDKGYIFNPDDLIISLDETRVFAAGGKTILLSEGLLYRPSKYIKEYNFSNITPSQTFSYAIAYDKISKRLCKIEPVKDNIAQGIYGDKYAMDQVTEFSGFVNFENRKILFILEPTYTIETPMVRVVSTSSEGIHFDKFEINVDNTQVHTPENTIQVSGLGATNAIAVPVPDERDPTSWFFSIGNKIYSSPNILPALTEMVTIPSNLGIVTDMKLSAKATELAITTYNAGSTNNYKGSLVIVNIVSKKMTIYENVMHKPVSLLAADANPWW